MILNKNELNMVLLIYRDLLKCEIDFLSSYFYHSLQEKEYEIELRIINKLIKLINKTL